jgi:hypothetical protein
MNGRKPSIRSSIEKSVTHRLTASAPYGRAHATAAIGSAGGFGSSNYQNNAERSSETLPAAFPESEY